MLAKTGMRREELLMLHDKDLNIDEWIIKAPVTGKRLEFRPLFLDDESMLVILDYLDWRDEYASSEFLFVSPNTGDKLHRDYPNHYLRKVGLQLGIHDPAGPLDHRLTSHCWRWFFTTQMHRAKMDEQYIKYLRGDVLGSRAAWEGYLNIDTELLRLEYLRCVPHLL
jgi:integrase